MQTIKSPFLPIFGSKIARIGLFVPNMVPNGRAALVLPDKQHLPSIWRIELTTARKNMIFE